MSLTSKLVGKLEFSSAFCWLVVAINLPCLIFLFCRFGPRYDYSANEYLTCREISVWWWKIVLFSRSEPPTAASATFFGLVRLIFSPPPFAKPWICQVMETPTAPSPSSPKSGKQRSHLIYKISEVGHMPAFLRTFWVKRRLGLMQPSGEPQSAQAELLQRSLLPPAACSFLRWSLAISFAKAAARFDSPCSIACCNSGFNNLTYSTSTTESLAFVFVFLILIKALLQKMCKAGLQKPLRDCC